MRKLKFILVWWEYDKIEYRLTYGWVGQRFEDIHYREFIGINDII